MKRPCVAVLTTCDTKGKEAEYLREGILRQDVDALVIDTGILGDPTNTPDVSKHEVAANGGHTIAEVIATGSRGAAVEMMQEGVYNTVLSLYTAGKIDGLVALGGAEGSVLAAVAMEALPLGVPKLLVSPIASGTHRFNEIVRNNDAMVMHSIIDIVGINSISRVVFDNAVAAVSGMVKDRAAHKAVESGQKRIGVTILGTVTPPVKDFVMPALEARGYEVLTFHANGVGGDCMDKLIEGNYLDASIEYCVNEIVGIHYGGFHVSSRNRLDAAMKKNLPTVITPGCANLIALGRMETLTEEQRTRAMYKHNPEIILVRTNQEEMRTVAGTIAEKMNMSSGNVRLLFPARGFSSQDMEGKPLWDEKCDRVFLDVMREKLRKDIEIVEVDAHINDQMFADAVVNNLLSMLKIQ